MASDIKFLILSFGVWFMVMGVAPFSIPNHDEWSSTLMTDILVHCVGIVIVGIYIYDYIVKSKSE